MSKKLIFLLLAAVWVAVPSAVASLKYDTLTSADGLSNSSVNCIYQDSTLMMWFGTWDGLNAYNGYGFRTYKFAPDNANTISNNVIRNIVEEAKGILWVATDYGINRIDVENDRIERFYPGYEDNGPTAEQVFSVAAAADGTIFGDTCRLLRRAEYPAAAYRTGGAGSDSLRAVRDGEHGGAGKGRALPRRRGQVGVRQPDGALPGYGRCGNLPLRTP